MNTWTGSGLLTRDPDVRYTNNKNGETMAIAKFTIACQRKGRDAGADFIPIVAFGKTAEFVEKYFHQGHGIEVKGHIQTGSFDNKEGRKVYTTEVYAEEIEFPKGKKSESNYSAPQEQPSVPQNPEPQQPSFMQPAPQPQPEEETPAFMKIPDNIADNLPFR